jgi:tubulin---tyrosine ligase
VSYGTFVHPIPPTFHEPAHRLAAGIVNHLWSNWGSDEGGLRNGEVDLYNLNVPMIPRLLSDDGLEIIWTTMWRNSYGRLFKAHPSSILAAQQNVPTAGPDSSNADPASDTRLVTAVPPEKASGLVFKFSPDMTGLVNPSPTAVPVGSDGWAMLNGHVSVTPLRASFAEPSMKPEGEGERTWKIKL